ERERVVGRAERGPGLERESLVATIRRKYMDLRGVRSRGTFLDGDHVAIGSHRERERVVGRAKGGPGLEGEFLIAARRGEHGHFGGVAPLSALLDRKHVAAGGQRERE